MVKYLLDRGANAALANQQGTTPLLAAIQGGHIETLQLLIGAAPVSHSFFSACYQTRQIP